MLPFVQLLPQALQQMHYKAGEYFQIVAVEAELLFSQLLEFVAQSEIRMALAAESIVYEERGYCCDPYFVLGPETKPNHRRYRAPSAGVLLLFFRFYNFNAITRKFKKQTSLPLTCVPSRV